jgi:hypothetical protein
LNHPLQSEVYPGEFRLMVKRCIEPHNVHEPAPDTGPLQTPPSEKRRKTTFETPPKPARVALNREDRKRAVWCLHHKTSFIWSTRERSIPARKRALPGSGADRLTPEKQSAAPIRSL